MISIHAATRGLISNNLPLGIATDGLIYIPVVIPPSPSYGGGWIAPDYEWEKRERERKILEDDEEILNLISAITPFL